LCKQLVHDRENFVACLAHAINASTASGQITSISTKAGGLPYYAARSLLRMFIALFVFRGRYGELFDYDANDRELVLTAPEETAPAG